MGARLHIAVMLMFVAAAGEAAPQVTVLGDNPLVLEAGSAFVDPGVIPSGAAVKMAVGNAHSLAVTDEGTVVAWGDNGSGQTIVPAGLTDAAAVAGGTYHSLALKRDGTVVAWGSSGYNQATVPAGLSGVVAIAAGHYHSLALKSDGMVVGWGRNDAGQATAPAGLSGVVAIAAGAHHSLGLKSDGTVVGWGINNDNQITVPADLSGVVAIAAGAFHNLALKSDGTVAAWGRNDSGQAAVPADLNGVMAIAAGAAHSLALKSDGTVVAWGYNAQGQATVPAGLSGVTAIAGGGYYSLALKDDQTVVGWGNNFHGQTNGPAGLEVSLAGTPHIWGAVNPSVAGIYLLMYTVLDGVGGEGRAIRTVNVVDTTPPEVTLNGTTPINHSVGEAFDDPGATAMDTTAAVRALAGGGSHSLALKSDGTVVGWGTNGSGQVTVPADLSSVVAIAAGGSHSLALKSDGTVVGWGNNASFQATVPGGLGNVVAVAASENHSLALMSNGSLVAWGSNSNGQAMVPGALDSVVAIAGGYAHSLALKSDGTVVAWGNNVNGQATVPSELGNVVAIAAGSWHSLALKGDGTVVAWGNNNHGQITVPGGLTDVVAIAGGYAHSLALKSDGTVVGWGNNLYGQATAPMGLDNVVAIAAGLSHSLALKSDGTVVGWGIDAEGQATAPPGLSDRTGPIVVTGSVDPNTVGTYPLTYTAIDLAGNEGSAMRTVDVFDNEPPSLDVSGVSSTPYIAGQPLPDLTGYVLASDNSGSVSVVQSPAPGSIILAEGVFVVSFTAIDSSSHATGPLPVELVVDPLPAAATYTGLVEGRIFADSGFLTVTVSKFTSVSGKLTYGGQTYSFKGQFDATETLEVNISRKNASPLQIILQRSLDRGYDVIEGTVTDLTSGIVSDFASERAVYNAKANPCPFEGAYTMLIEPVPSPFEPLSYPQGMGSANVNVDASGRGRANGYLGDGTKFSVSQALTRDGGWAFSVVAYGKNGSFSASLLFRPDGFSNLGDVIWIKNPQPKDVYYPDGFGLYAFIDGALFASPAFPQRIIELPNLAGNAHILFEEGGIAGPLAHLLTVHASQKVEPLVPTGNKLALSLDSKQGRISGSFIHPASGKKVKLYGVIHQLLQIGAGMFFGVDETGFFEFAANPQFGNGLVPGDGSKKLPKVAFGSPGNKAGFPDSIPMVDVSGTAKADGGIVWVEYQVLYPDGTISAALPAAGMEDWMFSVAPAGPGAYTVFVKAIEGGTGNESALVSRSFTLVGP